MLLGPGCLSDIALDVRKLPLGPRDDAIQTGAPCAEMRRSLEGMISITLIIRAIKSLRDSFVLMTLSKMSSTDARSKGKASWNVLDAWTLYSEYAPWRFALGHWPWFLESQACSDFDHKKHDFWSLGLVLWKPHELFLAIIYFQMESNLIQKSSRRQQQHK